MTAHDDKRGVAEFAKRVVDDWDANAPKHCASYHVDVVSLARAYLETTPSHARHTCRPELYFDDKCEACVADQTTPSTTPQKTPDDVLEWMWHLDLHLTEHDLQHAGKALRAAWPVVRAYLAGVENERNTWRELAKNAESALSATPCSADPEVVELAREVLKRSTRRPVFEGHKLATEVLRLHRADGSTQS